MIIKNFLSDGENGRAVLVLNSGEYIRVSVLGDWCFVKNSRFGWLGKELYSEKGSNNIVVASALGAKSPRTPLPLPCGLVFDGFLQGIATCSTAKEVELLLTSTYAEMVHV